MENNDQRKIRWEYMWILRKVSIKEDKINLDHHGSDGWEVIFMDGSGSQYLMKRQYTDKD